MINRKGFRIKKEQKMGVKSYPVLETFQAKNKLPIKASFKQPDRK